MKKNKKATCDIVIGQYHQLQCHPNAIPFLSRSLEYLMFLQEKSDISASELCALVFLFFKGCVL